MVSSWLLASLSRFGPCYVFWDPSIINKDLIYGVDKHVYDIFFPIHEKIAKSLVPATTYMAVTAIVMVMLPG